MALFTFHSYRADGTPVAMDVRDLATPDAARAYARHVLSEHGSAQQVVVCLGDVEVAQVWRDPV